MQLATHITSTFNVIFDTANLVSKSDSLITPRLIFFDDLMTNYQSVGIEKLKIAGSGEARAKKSYGLIKKQRRLL
ncbi:MAG: hypothetical protein IPI97_00630 [Nitrosomonas sp.]|nr:hypothetical protein [Nitrosomonas sp.]